MNPIKTTIKTEIIPILIIILSIILGGYFYANFPDQVPAHWNIEGEVDGYTSKIVSAVMMPAIMIGLYVMFWALPYIDPKKDRYKQFSKTYQLFRTMIIIFLFVIYILTGLFALGYPINIGMAIPMLVGLMFVVMGNYMNKIKNNWFMGIRTPWTLSSENVWNKTHRLSGKLFMLVGIVMMSMPFLPENIGIALLITSVVLLTLGSTVYSYYLYTKEKK
jgi:uncharacterized membrane protein